MPPDWILPLDGFHPGLIRAIGETARRRRQTFPVTVGAIQFISYEQVLWGQMAAATIVAALPQLVLSLMVQKYIVRGLTMGAVK